MNPNSVASEEYSALRLLVLLSTAKNDNGIGRLSLSLCKAMQEIPATLRTVALPSPHEAEVRRRSVAEQAGFALRAVVASRGASVAVVGHIALSPVARLTAIRHRICLLYGFESWGRVVRNPAPWRYWAISRYTADRFQANNPEARVSIIPVPIDEVFAKDYAACTDPPLVRACQAAFPDGYVLTVGRMGSGDGYKGYARLLRCFRDVVAARHHARIGIVLVGDGSSRTDLQIQAEQMGLGSNARFVGKVTDATLGALYARAQAFCLPSERTGAAASGEGFGLVYLEAASQGTPVIAAASAGASEAVSPEIGRLLPPSDDGELLRALLEAFDAPHAIGSAARAARREFVLSRHSPAITRQWCKEQLRQMGCLP